MSFRIILVAFCIIFNVIASGQSVLSDTTKAVVAELSSFDIIMDEVMYHGEGGVGPTFKPRVYSTFEQLVAVAGEDELLELCYHQNALVACYAFKGLLEKQSTRVIEVVLSLESNRKKVEVVSDDIIESPEIFLWMINEAFNYQKYEDFGFTDADILLLQNLREKRRQIIKSEADEEIRLWEENNRNH